MKEKNIMVTKKFLLDDLLEEIDEFRNSVEDGNIEDIEIIIYNNGDIEIYGEFKSVLNKKINI